MADRLLLLSVAALAAALLSVTAKGDLVGDCRCECCLPELCPLKGTTFISTGSKDACTPAACAAEVAQCPDSGSHNAGGQVTATYLDCECSCCEGGQCMPANKHLFPSGGPTYCSPEACAEQFETACPLRQDTKVYASYFDCGCKCCANEEACVAKDFTTQVFRAGTAARCTEAQCSSRFAQCLDSGSHNEGSQVIATFNGAAPLDLNDDCKCTCNDGADWQDPTIRSFRAGSREECSADHCRANFAACPDEGSHNEAAQVFATYFDCTCSCCDSDNCAAGRSDFTQETFFAGGPAACSAAQCSSRFAGCPDVGAHNQGTGAVVHASYSPPGLHLAGPAPPPGRGEGGGGGLSPGATAGVAVAAGGPVLILLGWGAYYLARRRQGMYLRWTSVTDNELASLSDPGVGGQESDYTGDRDHRERVGLPPSTGVKVVVDSRPAV